ncbi:M20/M25/M40 family metallo-hydrolase [Candidatus Riflebacteria bacterium]
MRYLLVTLALFFICSFLNAEKLWITIGENFLSSLKDDVPLEIASRNFDGIRLIKIDKKDFPQFITSMHRVCGRCPGFFHHQSKEEGLLELNRGFTRDLAAKRIFVPYSISEPDTVESFIGQVQEENIVAFLKTYSSFHTRYHRSEAVKEAMKWLKDYWTELTRGRDDVEIKFFKHQSSPQSSLILSIRGSEKPDKILVAGSHSDSISSSWGSANARAPGADDNGSGIAVLSETLRILCENDYRPKNTLQLMAYAAEEVGLRGSKEIARQYKQADKNVIGVLNLDMTNYPGSSIPIILTSDYTNHAQNEFLGKLIDRYLKLNWVYEKAGYACSDHASWHSHGFPTTYPFESLDKDMNPNIHSNRDNLDVTGGRAEHSVHFTKIALAYLVEMTK